MKKDIISADNKLKDIKELTKSIENSSNFVKKLIGDDKRLYGNIVQRVRNDTNGEFTDTEYESISKMILFCDRFEEYFNAVGVSEVETEMLDLYRKMKTQITIFMQNYRDGKKVTPPSIQMIKIQLNKLTGIIDEIDEFDVVDTKAVVVETEAVILEDETSSDEKVDK